MKKKIITLLLSSFLLMGLVACNTSDDKDDTATQTDASTELSSEIPKIILPKALQQKK